MKTHTRKYKTKNRKTKTRRGGSTEDKIEITYGAQKPNLPVAKPNLPVSKPNLPVANPNLPVANPQPMPQPMPQKKPVSWFSSISFFSNPKPGDKIIKAVDELIKLIEEKSISTDLKLDQIKSEAAKLT